jgi:hypothetical protein
LPSFSRRLGLNPEKDLRYPVLYHYTSTSGALKILESQRFWATAHEGDNLASASVDLQALGSSAATPFKEPAIKLDLQQTLASMESTVFFTCSSREAAQRPVGAASSGPGDRQHSWLPHFHVTNLPLALLVTALWLIVFFRVRSAFSGVFVERVL